MAARSSSPIIGFAAGIIVTAPEVADALSLFLNNPIGL
jgi:hypothetical protein